MKKDSNLYRLLQGIYKRMNRNRDYVLCICGEEGEGKSRGLLLNIVHTWYTDFLKKPIPSYSVSTDLNGYINGLEKGEKFDIVALDEAGDALYSGDARKKLNSQIGKSYTIIREKIFFSIIALPDFFKLQSSFRDRRVRLLLQAYKRVDKKCLNCGEYFIQKICPYCGHEKHENNFVIWKAYSRKRINKILEDNKNKHYKSIESSSAKPLITGIVYEYDGPMLPLYDKMKQQKTDDTLAELKEASKSDTRETDKKRKRHKHTWKYMARTKVWKCVMCREISEEQPEEY